MIKRVTIMADETLIQDSVVMGNVEVTNNIVISRDALANLSFDEVTNAMANFYGKSVVIDTGSGETDLISELQKNIQKVKKEIE